MQHKSGNASGCAWLPPPLTPPWQACIRARASAAGVGEGIRNPTASFNNLVGPGKQRGLDFNPDGARGF